MLTYGRHYGIFGRKKVDAFPRHCHARGLDSPILFVEQEVRY